MRSVPPSQSWHVYLRNSFPPVLHQGVILLNLTDITLHDLNTWSALPSPGSSNNIPIAVDNLLHHMLKGLTSTDKTLNGIFQQSSADIYKFQDATRAIRPSFHLLKALTKRLSKVVEPDTVAALKQLTSLNCDSSDSLLSFYTQFTTLITPAFPDLSYKYADTIVKLYVQNLRFAKGLLLTQFYTQETISQSASPEDLLRVTLETIYDHLVASAPKQSSSTDSKSEKENTNKGRSQGKEKKKNPNSKGASYY
jgi:hypothetical protein